MVICLQIGAMMGKWCMKTSLKQQRNFTLNIVLEWEGGSVYKVELQLGQVVAVKKFHSI